MHLISPSDPLIQYTGRTDRSEPGKVLFTWVYSSFRFILKGKEAKLLLEGLRGYWQNIVGLIVNGAELRFPLPDGQQEVDLSPFLIDEINDVLVYKRQDACNYFAFRGIQTSGMLLPPPERPQRRIEVYGDSVSAGELCEAMHLAGKCDPENHEGVYSNSWYSYAAQTARALNAELNNISQGGIALKNGTGWFYGPDYIGLESCWDKCAYNPYIAPVTDWDFSVWIPQLVIVAIGQNDAHPEDLMKQDPQSEKALNWVKDYSSFIEKLREKYPKAEIILLTTVLMHDAAWDDAVERACRMCADERVHHFLFHRNGIATPGHPRVSEHTEMARELTQYILSLGDEIWTR